LTEWDTEKRLKGVTPRVKGYSRRHGLEGIPDNDTIHRPSNTYIWRQNKQLPESKHYIKIIVRGKGNNLSRAERVKIKTVLLRLIEQYDLKYVFISE
jgi:hypothetical protein